MKNRFSGVMKQLFSSYMENIHTVIPGTIQNYSASTKKASVKPSIKKQLNNEIISYPVITNVPVIFPGSNDVSIIFPLSKGDGVLILFSEESLERYLSSKGEEVEPGESRKFALSDAVCIPGLFPFGSPGKTGGLTGLEVIYKTTKIKIDDTGITLQSNDAISWLPNVLAVDPLTGVPHGGPGGGILKLKGA